MKKLSPVCVIKQNVSKVIAMESAIAFKLTENIHFHLHILSQYVVNVNFGSLFTFSGFMFSDQVLTLKKITLSIEQVKK